MYIQLRYDKVSLGRELAGDDQSGKGCRDAASTNRASAAWLGALRIKLLMLVLLTLSMLLLLS